MKVSIHTCMLPFTSRHNSVILLIVSRLTDPAGFSPTDNIIGSLAGKRLAIMKNINTLKFAEFAIKTLTNTLQLALYAVIAYMCVMLAVSTLNRNITINRIDCGTYVLDSQRAWLEVVNTNDNSHILTITLDCEDNTIVSVVGG